MKSTAGPQSATSLPRAPRDDAGSRTLRYFIMMAVRVACFVLMVVITPYGWHTLLLGVGAVVLPYLAVVIANVGQDGRRATAVSPERALPAAAETPVRAPSTQVIRIQETAAMDAGPAARPADTAAEAPDTGAEGPGTGPKDDDPTTGHPS